MALSLFEHLLYANPFTLNHMRLSLEIRCISSLVLLFQYMVLNKWLELGVPGSVLGSAFVSPDKSCDLPKVPFFFSKLNAKG